MANRTLVMLGTVPIPVGHQVEVYTLTRDLGLFGKDIRPVADEPMVRDLTTGIYYGRLWQFAPGPNATIQVPRSSQPAEEVTIAERITGRVIACVIATEGVSQHQAAQTTLVVEEGATLG